MGAHHAGGSLLLRMVLLVGPLCKKPHGRRRMQLFGLCAMSVHPVYLIFCLCSASVQCLRWLEEKSWEHVPGCGGGCLLRVSLVTWATTPFPKVAKSCPALNACARWGHPGGHPVLALAASQHLSDLLWTCAEIGEASLEKVFK